MGAFKVFDDFIDANHSFSSAKCFHDGRDAKHDFALQVTDEIIGVVDGVIWSASRDAFLINGMKEAIFQSDV